MNAIIQRIMVGDETVSTITQWTVLVGISSDDNAKKAEWMWPTKIAQSTAVR
uniref:Uncharacterized protein n=1 Tax=Anopheles funestus TaxID=62324 RepID=A0A4Y0BGL6_ANOFN